MPLDLGRIPDFSDFEADEKPIAEAGPTGESALEGKFEGQDWTKPADFSTKTKAEPFPLAVLPNKMRAAVDEVQAFIQSPLALVAQSALAAVAVVAQGLVDVRREPRLEGPVSLFLMALAESGERKTAADKLFTAAIRDFQLETEIAMADEIKKASADFDAWESKVSGVRTAIKDASKAGKGTDGLEAQLVRLHQNKPAIPMLPEYLLGDETPESLAHKLAHRWPVAGILSNEAGIVLGSHSMGSDSVMRNLSLLNVLWDGGEVSIGRKTSESFTVRDCRLTVSLQIQRGTLQGFLDKCGTLSRDIGFFARFLICEPESTQGTRKFIAAPENWPRLTSFSERLRALLSEALKHKVGGGVERVMLELSSEAKAAWIVYHDAVEEGLSPFGEMADIRDVASKSADNAVRLAALFHVFEHGPNGNIDAGTFKSAAMLAAWYLSEAKRFHCEFVQPEEYKNAAKLSDFLVDRCRKDGKRFVPRSYVLQNGPPGTRNAAKLDAAIAVLDELGRVRSAKHERTSVLLVNPALIGRDEK